MREKESFGSSIKVMQNNSSYLLAWTDTFQNFHNYLFFSLTFRHFHLRNEDFIHPLPRAPVSPLSPGFVSCFSFLVSISRCLRLFVFLCVLSFFLFFFFFSLLFLFFSFYYYFFIITFYYLLFFLSFLFLFFIYFFSSLPFTTYFSSSYPSSSSFFFNFIITFYFVSIIFCFISIVFVFFLLLSSSEFSFPFSYSYSSASPSSFSCTPLSFLLSSSFSSPPHIYLQNHLYFPNFFHIMLIAPS